MTEQPHDQERSQRFSDDDDQHRRQHGDRLPQHDRAVDQHADGHEEQHREGVAQRQRLGCRTLAQLGFAQDHAREESAERE